MLNESVTAPLSQEVYERLLAWLRETAPAPDTRLPGEHQLALRFAVSRPVLRQALARLRVEGRLYARKGSGTFIRAPAESVPAITYDALANIPDVRSFLEFRCSLEGELAAHAAQRRTPDDIAAIERAQRTLEEDIAAGRPGIEEDIALHAAIARASGNRFFVATLAALADQTRFSIKLTRELATRPAAERFKDIRREHAAICDAIADGDAERARNAMVTHLHGGIERLFGQTAG